MKTALLLVFTAVLFVLGVSSARVVRTPTGTLRLDTKTRRGADGYFGGSFRALSGKGIRFTSQDGYLSVMTLDRRPVVQVRKMNDEGDELYVNVLGQSFAQEKSSPHMHAVPSHYEHEDVEAFFATPEGRKTFVAEMQAVGDQATHEAAVMSAMQNLASSREAVLMEEAARGLGIDMGITGKDEPAILPFYLVALQLSKMRNAEVQKSERLSFSYYSGYYSAHSQAYPNCDLTTCPPCRADECIGLCGRLCNCWSWVCGDCCYHRGCRDHDLCCLRRGFSHFRCLFPFGLRCSSSYSC